MTPEPGALSSRPGGLLVGFGLLPRGGFYLVRHPRLWPYAALPLLFNLVVFSVLGVYAVTHLLPWLVDKIVPALHFEKLPTWLSHAWIDPLTGAFRSLMRGLAYLISLILMLLIGGVSFTAVGTVLAAPFNDVLSERVEGMLRGEANQREFNFGNLLEDVVRTVVQAARKMLIVALVFLVTLPMLLVPVVGAVAYTVLNGAVATWFLAMEYIDLPMGRAGWTIPQRQAWAWARRPTVFGFGTGVYMTFLVPLLGYLVMPAAVVGGTMLFVEHSDPRELGAEKLTDEPAPNLT